MFSKVNGSALVGMESHPVQVEVDVTSGLPAFEIVGLPDAAVRESRVRVKSAIRNSGFEFPNRRVHVNLAPADLKKEGPSFDLPLALALLEATEQFLPRMPRGYFAVGELSLHGEVREVSGVLSSTLGARSRNAPLMLVPTGNAREAALASGVEIFGVSTLGEAVRFLEGLVHLNRTSVDVSGLLQSVETDAPDLAEVKGQEHVKRALEIAAAGGHNVLMVGPPGSGKTMLARRLPGILPPMSTEEALEVTRLYSVAGLISPGDSLVTQRPFRAPHHSISAVGLTGGGVPLPRPGEVALASHGVLYLDEFTLYARNALDSLRGPLEDGMVTIVRSMTSVTYPSHFCLVASMNPCPCGYFGDPRRECACSAGEIQRYRSRVSGPLLDRIDVQVEVPRMTREQLQKRNPGESSSVIVARVARARELQRERLSAHGVYSNSDMGHGLLERYCGLTEDGERFLGMAVERLGLSARSYHRVLRVARTISDLSGARDIAVEHLAEAVQYRCLERPVFV